MSCASDQQHDLGSFTDGEVPAALVVQFIDRVTRDPINVLGFDATFVMRRRSGTPQLQGAATIEGDGSTGEVRYQWKPGDMQETGVWDGEMWIYDGTLLIISEPLSWSVHASIVTTPPYP